VVGYASGNYDPANNRYVVTEADAHSWVEIYFTSRGWVEFEPTASLPLIQRPDAQVWPGKPVGCTDAKQPPSLDLCEQSRFESIWCLY
jgi:transglutaminase-like putative cysteine protease